jgi:translation initiation factor IF-1
MGKQNVTVKEGSVIEALPNTTFRIELDEDKRLVLCTLSGKMRMYRIRVMPGDRVKVEFTPYDENKGRIVYRMK